MQRIIGKVAFTPKGTWVYELAYEKLDVVVADNVMYIALKSVPAGTDISNTQYWQRSINGSVVPESVIEEQVNTYVNAHSAGFATKTELTSAVGEINGDIDDLKEDIESQEKALEKTDKSLEALWKLNKGQTYDFYTETKTSHIDDVTSGGRYASIDVLGGKSVVWNQLISFENNTRISEGVTFNISENGTVTANGTSSGVAYTNFTAQVKNGRKYLLIGCPSGGSATTYKSYVTGGGAQSETDYGNGVIFATNSDGIRYVASAYISNGYTANNLVFKTRLIDLTQMFGAGNEPTTTTDERIKAIEKYAEENPAYNVGEIISNPISEIKSVGANIIDGNSAVALWNGTQTTNLIKFENDTISVNGQLWYAYSNPYIFSEEPIDITISLEITNKTASSPRIGFLRVIDGVKTPVLNISASTSSTSISNVNAIRLDWNGAGNFDVSKLMIVKGSSATEYSPYMTDTIEIPEAITSLDGYGIGINDNCYNSIEFDGDKVYFHKRVGVVDLGSLSWIYNARGYFMAEISDIANWDSNSTVSTKIICNNYYNGTFDSVYAGSSDLTISQIQGGKKIGVVNTSYTDATTFKNAMASQNAKLYYELATEQITDITDLYTNDSTLECEGNGTLTYIGENDMPIPHTMTFIRKLDEVQ